MQLIGRTHGPKNQIRVLELIKERQNSKKVYKVSCSICAEDNELHGNAEYIMYRASIIKGRLPCGCSHNPPWTKEQYAIRVARLCKEKGYNFHGFCEWNGVQTKLKLSCSYEGNEWESLTISRLFSGHGCPECAVLGRSLSDQEWIDKFMKTGNFLEGTNFSRSDIKGIDGRARSWTYDCPVCSIDSFVTSGVCTGLFTSPTHSLLSGSKSCRCSLSYRSNKAQKEHHINKIIKDECLNISFIGWVGEYIDGDSKVILDCDEHGIWEVRYSSFISQGSRCPGCAVTGYSQNSPGSIYILKHEDITKVGITNRAVITRVQEINRSSGMSFEEVYSLCSHDGRVPRTLESKVLSMLKSKYPQVSEKFSGSTECFLGVDTSEIIDYIISESIS